MSRPTARTGRRTSAWRPPPAEAGSDGGGILERAARGAQAVEVEPCVVDREAQITGQPVGHRRHVLLADLLDAPAPIAGEVVVVLGPAGDIAVDMAVLLETAGHSRRDERLERAEHGRPTDARLAPSEPLVEVLGSDLAPVGRQGVRHEQALAGHALAGGSEAIGGGGVGSGRGCGGGHGFEG